MKRLFHPEFIWITILTFTVTALLALVTVNVSFLNPIASGLANFSFMSVYNDIKASEATPKRSDVITIVDISDLFNRGKFAELIYTLEDMGPQLVAFDVVFDGTRGDTVGSELLGEAVRTMDNAVFGYRLKDYDSEAGEYTVAGRSFFADSVPVTQGFTNVRRDVIGRIEKMYYYRTLNGERVNSLSYEMAKAYDPETVQGLEGEEFYVDFTPTIFDVVPYDSVEYHPELIEGRIVLVGDINDVLDHHYTPLGKIPGVCFQALGVQTILDYKHVKDINHTWSYVLLVLITWMAAILYYHYNRFCLAPHRNPLVYFFCTGLVTTLLIFCWTALIMGFSFFLLDHFGVNYNPCIAVTCSIMSCTAVNFERALVLFCQQRWNWSFLRHSLFYKRQ